MNRAFGFRSRDSEASESGFTLIEVVVALFLLGVVATAVLMFYVRGVQSTAQLQRSQSASAVAMEAMEAVQAIDPQAVAASGAKTLVAGRLKSAVDAAAAAAPSDTLDSTPAFDGAATGASTPTIPITSTVLRDNTSYTVTTLIGICYRVSSLTGGTQACAKTTATGAVPVYRATVVVAWKPTSSKQCNGASVCTYRISALVDGNADASWNLTARPVAYDDEISLDASAAPATAQYEIVKTNDIIGTVTSNPVIVVTPPAGTYSMITSGAQMGMLRYAPSPGYSGVTTMVYKLRDAAGRTSNEAKVVITVKPGVANDSFSVYKGDSTVVDVLANDLGTFTGGSRVNITSGPAVGTLTVAGTSVTYNAPATGTSTTFKYTVTDASGLTSTEATATVTLLSVAPSANDFPVTLVAMATPTAKDLGFMAATGNDATAKFVVATGPTDASTWGNVGTLTGTNTNTVSYRPVANKIGVYALTYYVQDTAGTKSATKTVTITVIPVANPENPTVSHGSNLGATNLATNDIGVAGMTYTMVGSPVCTRGTGVTASITAAGALTFHAPSQSGSCAVSYTISQTKGSSTVSVSSSVTVTVTS